MAYEFKSEKYPGKTIGQIALIDYCNLISILEHRKGRNDLLTKHIEDVVSRLNNFIPKDNCSKPNCNNPAEYFPLDITVEDVYNPYKGKHMPSPTNIYIGREDIRCKNHINSRDLANSRASLYKIKFDTLELFSKEPKRVIKEITEALLSFAGWNSGWKKSAEKCGNFIYDLPQKSMTQLSLFKHNL